MSEPKDILIIGDAPSAVLSAGALRQRLDDVAVVLIARPGTTLQGVIATLQALIENTGAVTAPNPEPAR